MEFATRVILLLALSKIAVSEPGVAKDNRVTVLKCCGSDETLEATNGTGLPRCVPSGSKWNPLIYSQTQKDIIDIPANWVILENTRPSCDNRVLSFIPQPEHVHELQTFFETGEVGLNGGYGQQFGRRKYCAENTGLLVCGTTAAPKTKIRRCCGVSGAWDTESKNCIVQIEPETPLIENISEFSVVDGWQNCNESTGHNIVGNASAGRISSDGAIQFDTFRVPAGQFCIERIAGNKLVKVFACIEFAQQSPEVLRAADIRFTLYPVGFLISVVFLAATLAAGWLLPTAHHVLHWRCQTHHVACLMLGDLLMAIIQLGGNSLHGTACKVVAIMAHFFFLAAFFWLNTMCFNIWWTFRDLRPASLEKGQETLRLRVYACYAWGGPLLVAGLAALFDHLPPQPGYTFLRPRFGENNCWFYGDMEILTYFHGPVGALLAVNLLLFAATTRELTCGLWKREVVKSTTERAALGRVCMKLVVVMGVTWIADVLSWAVGGPRYLWYFTDLINAFQGVFIFAVVGCQPQVWTALKRLCNRNPRANAGRQGNAMSTTSHGMPSMGDSVTQNQSTKTVPLETIC